MIAAGRDQRNGVAPPESDRPKNWGRTLCIGLGCMIVALPVMQLLFRQITGQSDEDEDCPAWGPLVSVQRAGHLVLHVQETGDKENKRDWLEAVATLANSFARSFVTIMEITAVDARSLYHASKELLFSKIYWGNDGDEDDLAWGQMVSVTQAGSSILHAEEVGHKRGLLEAMVILVKFLARPFAMFVGIIALVVRSWYRASKAEQAADARTAAATREATAADLRTAAAQERETACKIREKAAHSAISVAETSFGVATAAATAFNDLTAAAEARATVAEAAQHVLSQKMAAVLIRARLADAGRLEASRNLATLQTRMPLSIKSQVACAKITAATSVVELKFSFTCGRALSTTTCAHIAGLGNLGLLKCARQQNCPWDGSTCSKAAEGGHLGVLQWARSNGCSWNSHTCSWAAKRGHLEILQWARLNGCPWGSLTCCFAAKIGRLDIVQWARTHGCPWDAATCSWAAKGGHMNVLKWARANGCPWDSFTCTLAEEHGHLEVLQWARANGCPE